MTDFIKIELIGFDALEKCLQELPGKVAKKYLQKAMREGLKIIQQSEKTLAPKRTGNLARSIEIYQARKKIAGAQLTMSVKPLRKWHGKKGYHAMLVEYGTQPHMIYPTKALALYLGGGGSGWLRSSVHHPGTRPQPFLRPSWDSNLENMFARIGNVLAENIFEEIGTYNFQDKWVKTISIGG